VIRNALSLIPVDRLLLETDAPETLAPLWGLAPEELCRQATANAMTVFNLSAMS
jgi:Tat protein secretion system quality control protein TatD with DNase activity